MEPPKKGSFVGATNANFGGTMSRSAFAPCGSLYVVQLQTRKSRQKRVHQALNSGTASPPPPPPITNPPTKALPTFVPPPSQIDMVLVYIVRVPFSSEGPCQQQPFPPSQSSKCGKTVEASTECAGWRPFMRGLGTNCRIILCTSPRQDTWRTRSPSRWRACTATWSRRIWCIKIVHLLLDDSNQPVAISCLTWWPGSHLAETLVL